MRQSNTAQWEKDYERYIERYAQDYCNGDIEVAKQHALVKEVEKQYKQQSE